HYRHFPTPTMDDNYYDISISSKKPYSASSIIPAIKKKFGPKRIGSLNSLSTLSEASVPMAHSSIKRPGDYFVQKLSKETRTGDSRHVDIHRPISGDSIVSLHSNFSDEASLVASSQFDTPKELGNPMLESRLSSMTSNSIINASPLDSPSFQYYKGAGDAHSFEAGDDDDDDLFNYHYANDENTHHNTSLSTITSKNSSLVLAKGPAYLPKASKTSPHLPRSASQSSGHSTSSLTHSSPPKKLAGRSAPGLSRSKTKFLSSKETKERQQLRKKKYEENDDDDEILVNDLDNLVFNVPVIKNHSELYLLNLKSQSSIHTPTTIKSASSSSVDLFTRSDLMVDNDNKYNINSKAHAKPRALSSPKSSTNGKLMVQTDLKNTRFSATEDSIVEEDEDSFPGHSSIDDSELTRNISSFYDQRSASFAKLVKSSREQTMMHKLPNFVKHQSSMDDLHLISQEKLNVIDQTRPVHLPPKPDGDKTKHNREFQKVLSNFELNNKSLNDARRKSNQILAQNQQQWIKMVIALIEEPNAKLFNKKFSYDKNTIRKLAWESNVPTSLRYQFFLKILSSNNGSQDSVNTINNSFNLFDKKYQELSASIKNNKDLEFNKIIERVLQRPLFECILKEIEVTVPNFSLVKFKESFRYLLYIKSLSEYGLLKHDEMFLIPLLLVLFQTTQSIQEIYCMVELINKEVFNRELLSDFNSALDTWTNPKQASYQSSYLSKYLGGFQASLGEFENLKSNSFFDILSQINDRLPLSLSAPSTPILAQQSFGIPVLWNSPNSSVSHSTEFSNSPENLTPRTSTSTGDEQHTEVNSSALQLMIKLLQMLIIYSNSVKTRNKNGKKVLQTFLMVIFQYYHINWNNFQELVKHNRSIKLNHSTDQVTNLNCFVDKWTEAFKKF
ncbi:uncharacterized protein CANTADRAFT_54040, partial [Suhomyces tanzawaensis NRRL Y-17324]